MATAGDVRDIMNLGQAGPRQPAPKKKKRVEPQIRLSGVTREVQALMGDSVPPIAIVEQKMYKSKPSISQKLFRPRHWEERTFIHGGRTDGLPLRHWKRSLPGAVRAQPVTIPTDVEMSNTDKEPESVPELRFEDEFPSEKWNVKPPLATYTDEQYESNFKSEDWTRQETDYLMDLCHDFHLRWILIADRYGPSEIPGDGPYPERTTEALKQRYYTIAAKMVEIETPVNNMTAEQFKRWETMKNFDAKTEILRKANAEKLFERTREEAEEEKLLLEELHRITKNEEEFIALRKDLYARLESAPVIRRTERGEEQFTAAYQSSQGLGMLLQTLLQKERRKRPTNPNEAPQSAAADPRRPSQIQHNRRDTMDSTNDSPAPTKKGSVSQPQVRTLTPAEEIKYGVTHPAERVTSGVQFRHDKINRLTMAKSQVQTSKIQAALGELGIPLRVLMATERVTREYERLVTNIHLLLDARKASEKVTNEIKVLEEAKRIRLGLPKEGEDNGPAQIDGEKMDVDSEKPREGATDADKADEDAEGEEDMDESRVETAADESTMQVDDANSENNHQSDAEGEEDDQSYAEARKDDDESQGEDDDDAEAEEEVEDDDEDDEGLNRLGKDDDDEDEDNAEVAEDSDDEVDEEDEEENGSDAAEEEDNEVEEEEEEEEDQDEEGGDDATPAVQGTPSGAEDAEDDAEGDEEGEPEPEPEPQPSRPSSSHSLAAKSHKRSASVISDASRAGSNRSGAGRKRRR